MPDKSLGVITCNKRQQEQVDDEIETLLKKHSDLAMHFNEEKEEYCFVKNLETVQGDERDVIIFSVGYGKNDDGKLRQNFGPLNRQGGERRLNVAVTRARDHVHLISSIRSSDINVEGTQYDGPKRLKDYIAYAEFGPSVLKSSTVNSVNDAESPFEVMVMQELESKGLMVRSQVGCSGFRIDLALVDPKNPNRYVLGIECDGATYHRSATARDRDRLRQEVLEDLGWRIVRVWSTDWMTNRQKQVQRIVATYDEQIKKGIAAPK